ncbi:DUF3304 domain-containing protein [Achromobacter marplatensis]|uniref:DUF3304 domain-containing protein n=1 Tax=Achromobacter marplatensis TaxID=470868 RepID=UPI0039F70C6B
MQILHLPTSWSALFQQFRLGVKLALGGLVIAYALDCGAVQAQPMPIPETIAVRLGIINYLDEGLAPVYINQSWAGGVRGRAYTSGTCCVSIPSQWKPGMTMRIEWNSDSMFERGENDLAARDAPVLPYPPFHSGYAWAIFLPGGEMRVQPGPTRPGAPDFLQGLPEPGEATEVELRSFIERTRPKP